MKKYSQINEQLYLQVEWALGCAIGNQIQGNCWQGLRDKTHHTLLDQLYSNIEWHLKETLKDFDEDV